MNEEIQWDSSLVKKFGSYNHSKLLTQLKTEIKAFPIKRRNSNIPSPNNKNNNNSHQSVISNIEETIISSPLEDGSNMIRNQQSQSLFRSKNNSFNNTNSAVNDSIKRNISNDALINPYNNNEPGGKLTNIYNNNQTTNNGIGNSEFNKRHSKVSFKDTDLNP